MTALHTTADLILSALRPYNLQEVGAGRYRSDSPLRPGSNSLAFSVMVKPDGEHGAWYDHVSSEGGSLYELASLLNITTAPTPQPSASSKRAYDGLEDYAREHGASAAVFEAARWEECTHNGRPALRFPTASGVRYRYLDGQKPPYQSPQGYQACWYGLKRAIELATANEHPLVLCNGEASTVVAHAYGIPAACVTGSGERPIPAELLEELTTKWRGAVVVAMDCDDKGRAAAPKIAAQLRDAGFEARTIDLGGTLGFDLADYCHLHGTDAAADLLSARPVAPVTRTWLTEEELEALPAPTPLRGSPLYERTIAVLYGPSGVGKTFYAITIAMQSAVQSGKPVLYVAAEDVEGVRIRKNAWRELYGETGGTFLTWPCEVNLMEPTQVANVIAETRELGLGLVVLDTLAQCAIGADDNSSKDMGLFMEAAKIIARETGATVLLVHHSGKSGGQERGSSAIRAAAYTMLEASDEDGVLRIACTKAKNSRPFDPLYFRLVEHGDSAVAVPAEYVRRDESRLTNNQRVILEQLALDIFANTGMSASEIERVTGIASKTMYRTLDHLKQANFIRQSEKGNPYHITDKGRKALQSAIVATVT